MKYSDKDIIKGSKGRELIDKKITLCITGSVAAYRSVDLARELIKHGAEVYVVMSDDATKIVHPYTFEWATGNPVTIEITGKVEHISLARDSDLVLVAPATANTIAKVAYGIADTSVTLVLSVALGYNKPIIFVPAMHGPMYENKVLKEALNRLKEAGIYIVEPKIEEEKAKFPDIEDIIHEILEILYPKDLIGHRILVTAGPTVEYLDPVRLFTNKSSGKMGISIAREALLRGGEVTLVLGRTHIKPPKGVKTIRIETTEDMYNAVMRELNNKRYNIFIGAGAPIDYKPLKSYDKKLDSRRYSRLEMKLIQTPKIIEEVRKKFKDLYIIAFKAEYKLTDRELIEKAIEYAKTLDLDLVIANDVSRVGVGFESDTNEVFIVNKDGLVEHISLSPKPEIAKKILDIVTKNISTSSTK